MAHQLIWITPSEVTGPQRSYERVTANLGDSADVTLKGLEVWETEAWDAYGLRTEVEGIARVAADHPLERFHLFGFSAGATVGLGAALSLGEAVQSLTVFEPATIGDDDWAIEEAAWRMEMARICNQLPVAARRAAFFTDDAATWCSCAGRGAEHRSLDRTNRSVGGDAGAGGVLKRRTRRDQSPMPCADWG